MALAEQARRFPDLLPLEPDIAGLEPRDAALALAIYGEAVRRWLTVSAVLEHALGRPMAMIEAPLRAVLLAGAAQLLLMDRIPDHAAVDESVELAKRLVRPKAGGLVNAGLRRIAGLRAGASQGAVPPAEQIGRDTLPLADGRVLSLKEPVLPAGGLELLSAATSNPEWLLRRWTGPGVGRDGPDRVRDLALHSLVSPPTVLNTTFARSPLPDILSPHRSPGHHVFTGSHVQLRELLKARTDIWVQDVASSRPVASVSFLRPSTIVDLCAGQGTKTRQLAATFPDARIFATDADPARLRTLRSAFAGDERVEALEPRELLMRTAGMADLVLLDVPCSNTGVLARRIEAKYRCGPTQLNRLADVQRQIIDDAVPLLNRSPRGRILYSTCSLEPEENDKQTSAAAQRHTLRIEREELTFPAGLPGGDTRDYRDGSYSALLF